MRLTSAVLLLGLVVAVTAFGSSDDRFLKKYAMMKIYESCFGADVVKEIRQEMKAACARCAASAEPKPTTNNNNQVFTGRLPPSLIQALSNSAGYLPLGDPSQDPNQSGDNSLGQLAGSQQENNMEQIQTPTLDTQKLQQAIYSAVRIPQSVQNYPVPNYAYRAPFGAVPYPQQSPFQQQSLFQPQPQFQSQSPFQPQMFQQAQSYLQPWGQPYQGGYQGGFVQPYPFFGNRASREMDFRTKLELLTSRTNGQVRNVTCVMQELGYLNQNLEPNYEKIAERIANLPVSDELKSDMQDGLQFCQEFSQCVPESKKNTSPLSRELLKPMFFFRCYKHKKLEACIMKDVRDKFGGEEELDTETDFRTLSRAGRGMKLDGDDSDKNSKEMDNEELAASMYDFLYGSHDAGTDAFV